MLVKGAPGVFDIVLFQVMTDGLMGTTPLFTCNDKQFILINYKTLIIVSHYYFNMWKISQ